MEGITLLRLLTLSPHPLHPSPTCPPTYSALICATRDIAVAVNKVTVAQNPAVL